MFTEIKYLNLLSPRLSRFKQKKRNLWNFRCPLCGDSQRNKLKCRGFVFEHKSDLLFKCHNCGASMSVPNLIEKLDVELYKEYRMEKFKDKNKPKYDTRKINRVVSQKPVFTKNILQGLVPVENLNNTHPAKQYLLNRMLPLQALYYTEKFQEWTNSVKPNTFQDIKQDEGRIIIPFRTKEGNVFGFQGRSLSSTGLRYITILLEDDQPKIFGLDQVNYEQNVFICEGPLDSLLLKNAVAMAGADLPDCAKWFPGGTVFVYDNEPRNKQITDRISHHISEGDSVVIWPGNIKEKDINDMILKGIPVQTIVESNVYSGLTATLKLKEWIK